MIFAHGNSRYRNI